MSSLRQFDLHPREKMFEMRLKNTLSLTLIFFDLAELFDTAPKNIMFHLKNIYVQDS